MDNGKILYNRDGVRAKLGLHNPNYVVVSDVGGDQIIFTRTEALALADAIRAHFKGAE